LVVKLSNFQKQLDIISKEYLADLFAWRLSSLHFP